jgi:hypothetical protein
MKRGTVADMPKKKPARENSELSERIDFRCRPELREDLTFLADGRTLELGTYCRMILTEHVRKEAARVRRAG